MVGQDLFLQQIGLIGFFQDPLHSLPVLAILTVCCYGGWVLSRTSRELTNEERELQRWRARLRRPTSVSIREHKAEISDALSKLNTNHKSVVGRAIDAVWRGRDSRPDLEAILTMVAQSEAARLSFPRQVPNWLLLLGLGGTVANLMTAISPLNSLIQNADPDSIRDNLQITLSGMGNAFTATLVGIVASVLMSFWVRSVTSKQSQLVGEIQDFIVGDLCPLILPQSREATVKDFKEAAEATREMVQFLPQIIAKTSEEFGRALESASEKIVVGVSTLERLSETISAQLHSSSKQMSEATNQLTSASSNVKEGALSLHHANVELSQRQESFSKELSASRDHLEQLIAQQLESISLQRNEISAIADRLIGEFQRSTEGSWAVSRSFETARKELSEGLMQNQSQIVSGFSGVSESVKVLFERHDNTIESVDSRLASIPDKFDELSQRLDPRMLPKEEWENLSKAMHSISAHPSVQVPSAINEFTKSVEELKEVLKRHKTKEDLNDGHRPEVNSDEIRKLNDNVEVVVKLLESNNVLLGNLERGIRSSELRSGQNHTEPDMVPSAVRSNAKRRGSWWDRLKRRRN